MIIMLEQIIQGAVGGLVYAFSGFANKPSKEKFDYAKMGTSVVIAALVGAVAGYTGQDFGVVANSALAMAITTVVQKGYSAISKKFLK